MNGYRPYTPFDPRQTAARFTPCLALALALFCGGSAADSKTLDTAVKQYYAGQPETAIAMIEPLAVAGDAEAQYLLGNILYTLARSGQGAGDPEPWYRRAAAQDSAAASYALGTLMQNRWLQSRHEEDAEQAQAFLQRAVTLGQAGAQDALDKLVSHRRTAAKNNSLTYTNDSFSSKRSTLPKEPPPQQSPSIAQQRPEKPVTSLDELLSRFESSGDPVKDAQNLGKLLGQMDDPTLAGTTGNGVTAIESLGGFDSMEDLLGKLIELYGHIEAATELSTAPGAN